MSELEEKLNALLSDPNSMAQVMQMAQQLSGAMGEQKAAPPPISEHYQIDIIIPRYESLVSNCT